MLAIESRNLSVRLSGKLILEDLSFDVKPHTFTVIFGPNGGGKTTLLRTIIGEISPIIGSISIFERLPGDKRLRIGYVTQSAGAYQEFPIRVDKVVMTGRYGKLGLFRSPSINDHKVVDGVLEMCGLSSVRNLYLEDLSGGQRQRVFLARAMALEPQLLLLDEVTSGIDIGVRDSLYELLARLKKDATVVLVTHDMSVVSSEVDQVLCLNNRLVAHGKPEEVLTKEAIGCMYGSSVSVFAHCDIPHLHVKSHQERGEK